MRLGLATQVWAEELIPDYDMVLCGDTTVGVGMFLPVREVLLDGMKCIIRFGSGLEEVVVTPTTEVIRLEQGNLARPVRTNGVQPRGSFGHRSWLPADALGEDAA